LSIGELARRAAIRPSALRYYEPIGRDRAPRRGVPSIFALLGLSSLDLRE
jgi:hypothetical protein